MKNAKSKPGEFWKRFCRPSLFVFLLPFLGCGEEAINPSTDDAYTVQIIDYTFVPDSLEVRAGDLVFFQNFDVMPHLILSQSLPDLFDDTGAFSSSFIDINEVGFIVVPEDALAGALYYFYSDVLQDAMVTPTGTLTVID